MYASIFINNVILVTEHEEATLAPAKSWWPARMLAAPSMISKDWQTLGRHIAGGSCSSCIHWYPGRDVRREGEGQRTLSDNVVEILDCHNYTWIGYGLGNHGIAFRLALGPRKSHRTDFSKNWNPSEKPRSLLFFSPERQVLGRRFRLVRWKIWLPVMGWVLTDRWTPSALKRRKKAGAWGFLQLGRSWDTFQLIIWWYNWDLCWDWKWKLRSHRIENCSGGAQGPDWDNLGWEGLVARCEDPNVHDLPFLM